ncbi:hypothetical protein SDC9_174195 [bioreactor metagenome]|uniref:Uncharacterized protein n=1 Tax=bioreactor metagenome TaxID=1076179 RepID=A0A645GKU8_9ZZZZ
MDGAGESKVNRNLPRLLLRDKRGPELLCIRLHHIVVAGSQEVHESPLLRCTHSLLVIDIPVWTADGDHFGPKLGCLDCSTPGNIAESADGDAFALEAVIVCLKHGLGKVHRAIAGSLGTDQRATIAQALAGQNTGILLPDALVLPIQVPDLPGPHSDVPCRNVSIRTDVFLKLSHEGAAETKDFRITLATGIEVTATLAATHGKGRQAVFQGLFETEELQ